MNKDKLYKDREKVMNNFVDEVFKYCQIHNITFIYEILFLLSFMISKAVETLFEGVEE